VYLGDGRMFGECWCSWEWRINRLSRSALDVSFQGLFCRNKTR
jgi:hypothetical protein